MSHLLIFGLGYTATRLATQLRGLGWQVSGVTRDGRNGSLRWGDSAIAPRIASATHILSSVPPATGDPVLDQYGASLRNWRGTWLGYLSTTGVYGHTQGAWVDEDSPLNDSIRSTPRALAEAAWRALDTLAPVHIFRLPGIYGPGGRSALDRVREGRAHRIADLGDHVFCRIHVDDIVTTLIASLTHPAGPMTIYNVSDDAPASGNAVIEYTCDLLALPYPPLLPLDDAGLSAMARSFYTSGWRRVRNNKIKHDLGVVLRYPTYREGLVACLKEERS
jgi:nucleoside-diphosphate-sugar epimerase